MGTHRPRPARMRSIGTVERTRRLAKAYLLCRLSLVHGLTRDFAFWLDRGHRKIRRRRIRPLSRACEPVRITDSSEYIQGELYLGCNSYLELDY